MAEQRRLKIGLAGASWFADLWYLPVIQMHPNAEIHAICSAGGESAKRMADKYSIPNVYGSWAEMLEEAELDGVCIVTPNDTHAPIAEAAMKRGIPVMCEKPLSLHLEEAVRLARLAEQSGAPSGVNFTYREHPGARRMKAMLEDGVIGRVLTGHFEYTGGYGASQPPGWRGTVSQGGIGGVLADLGSHLIDLAQFVTGDKIQAVSADAVFAHRSAYPEAAADSVSFLGRFEHGCRATFHTSWMEHQGSRGQTIRIRLTGEKGTIAFAASHLGASLSYALNKEKEVQVDLSAEVQPWQENGESTEPNFRPWRLTERNEIWKWIDRIGGRGSGAAEGSLNAPTFLDGCRVQAVMDAVMKSAQEERWSAVQL